MISHSIRAAMLATVFAVAMSCAGPSAHAASFDGPWSVLAVTRSGAWSQAPLLVTASTLHGPSNDAACADGPAQDIATAKTVASMAARMEWLIIGTLVLRRHRRAPGCGRSSFYSYGIERSGVLLTTRCGMVTRRGAAKEGASRC